MKNALDVGCGVGRQTLEVAKKIPNVTGIDITQKMIDLANMRAAPNVKFICGDVLDYPFSETFDYIYSILVLNHCDREAVLSKIHDLLNPGGVFLAWDWFGHTEESELSRLAGYYKARFRHKLSFNIVEVVMNIQRLMHSSDHPAWNDLDKHSAKYMITEAHYREIVEKILPGSNFDLVDNATVIILYKRDSTLPVA
jgi:SAM-dependent methyltransferase